MRDAKAGSIRVILVDDHSAFREGLRSLLGSYTDIEVVGEAENGEEVVHAMPYICPSAIVMDINEATRTIKARYPHVVIVGLSVHADNVYQTAMVDAGATSVVSKGMAGLFLYREIKAGIEHSPPVPNAA